MCVSLCKIKVIVLSRLFLGRYSVADIYVIKTVKVEALQRSRVLAAMTLLSPRSCVGASHVRCGAFSCYKVSPFANVSATLSL